MADFFSLFHTQVSSLRNRKQKFMLHMQWANRQLLFQNKRGIKEGFFKKNFIFFIVCDQLTLYHLKEKEIHRTFYLVIWIILIRIWFLYITKRVKSYKIIIYLYQFGIYLKPPNKAGCGRTPVFNVRLSVRVHSGKNSL